MLPDRVSNPGSLTYESGALPIGQCGPAPFTKRPFISWPGQSPGRAIVLPLASALGSAAALANDKVFTSKFLCDGQGAVRRAILCPCDRSC